MVSETKLLGTSSSPSLLGAPTRTLPLGLPVGSFELFRLGTLAETFARHVLVTAANGCYNAPMCRVEDQVK